MPDWCKLHYFISRKAWTERRYWICKRFLHFFWNSRRHEIKHFNFLKTLFKLHCFCNSCLLGRSHRAKFKEYYPNFNSLNILFTLFCKPVSQCNEEIDKKWIYKGVRQLVDQYSSRDGLLPTANLNIWTINEQCVH